MKHARKDYDRLQDPAGLIPDDEPVFLLRGQDAMAYKAVAHYAKLLHQEAHLRKDEKLEQMAETVDAHAQRMATWPKKKMPDLPQNL